MYYLFHFDTLNRMELKKVLLRDFTSLRIGGESTMVVVKSEKALEEAISRAKANKVRIHILGEGTNTYFGEKIKNTLILKNEIRGMMLQNTILTSYAGETWDDVVKYAIKNNLWGIENLSYIPGSAGAAPIQNIGAYGTELKDTLISVRVYDTKKEKFLVLKNNECHLGYRDSLFKRSPGRYIVISITIKLSKKKKPILRYKPLDSLLENKNVTLREIRNLVIKTRKKKLQDYTQYPNTGSFFKNVIVSSKKASDLKKKFPSILCIKQEGGYKIPTAWLIEHVAKMKGARDGSVGTWPIQPLVLVNYGKATSKELNTFAEKIVKKIKKETGIKLEREVNFVE